MSLEESKMTKNGIGALFMDPDPDIARAFFKNKSRALTDKIMSVKEELHRFLIITIMGKAVTYYDKR